MTPLFENCDAAAAAGVHNIPAGDPRYTRARDSDADGIGCENPDDAYVPLPPVGDVPTDPQIEQMPVGGADTGVAVAPESSHTGTAALGLAGLAAAATGGVVIARRRTVRAQPTSTARLCRLVGGQGLRPPAHRAPGA